MPLIDITGQTFGRLRVQRLHHKHKQAFWLCACTCGCSVVVAGYYLRCGHTTSCGCFHRERIGVLHRTHGKSGSPVYQRWHRMLRHYNNKQSKDYVNYGARGIRVCTRWRRFESFYQDMGDPPENMILGRKDATADYSKSNCRWVTPEQQANNRRNVQLYSYAGGMHNLAQISRICGVPYTTLRKRVKLGWPIHRATSTPIHHTVAYAERRTL